MDPELEEVILTGDPGATAIRSIRRVRGLLLGVVVSLATLSALAAPAAADRAPGPGYLDTGFADSYVLGDPLSSIRSAWLSRAHSIGSSYVRIVVPWYSIAPTKLTLGFQPANASDPRYTWSSLDGPVEDAVAHGQHVLLMLASPPAWALGSNPPRSVAAGTWRPSPSALGAFAHAVAERYSGQFPDSLHPGQNLPRVRYFQAWNEPNLPIMLTPQWTRSRDGQWIPASPSFYRRMLNAVYANVKAVQPDAYVLNAGTAPYGDPPGGNRMPPVVFTRELLCLSGPQLRPEWCPNPAHFDALDHHPYSFDPTYQAANPDDVSIAEFGRLKAILRVAQRTGRALPAGPKPIWMTELAWGSSPPDPFGLPLAQQARYLALAFYELWRQGVSHVFWLLARDYPYQSLAGDGVYFGNGNAKPSARAFSFPFVALPNPNGQLTLWGRAPTGGLVVIERGDGRGWQPLLELSTSTGGLFYARRRLGSHQVLRARIGSVASVPWTTG